MKEIQITKEIEALANVYHSLHKRNAKHIESSRNGILADCILHVIKWEALRGWVKQYDGDILDMYINSKDELYEQFEKSLTKFEKDLDIEGYCEFDDDGDDTIIGDSPMFECILSIPEHYRVYQALGIKKDATKVVEKKLNILTKICENELLISPEELMNVYRYNVLSSDMERGDEYIFENFVEEIAIEKLSQQGYTVSVKEYTSSDDDKTHKIIIGKK